MITIEFTRNGESGTKRVHQFALESTLRTFRAAGYTITSPATEAPAAPARRTGRVGKGLATHILTETGTACGSSWRRGLGGNIEVRETGEAVDCSHCLAI